MTASDWLLALLALMAGVSVGCVLMAIVQARAMQGCRGGGSLRRRWRLALAALELEDAARPIIPVTSRNEAAARRRPPGTQPYPLHTPPETFGRFNRN